MRAAIQGGGWAVLAVAAQMLTSCGGDVGVRHPSQEGSGGLANGSGGTLSSDGGRLPDPSVGGGGGSGGSAAGGGGMIQADAGASSGGRGGEGVEIAWNCSSVINDADPVTLSYVSGEPPTASGGTPVEGLYHLTKWELFTGPDGPGNGKIRTTQERIVITSVGDRTAEMAAMMGQPFGEMVIVYQWNVALTFDGSSFTSTPTCRTDYVSISDEASLAFSRIGGFFTATAAQLVLMTQSPEGEGTWVRTYTLQ